jgi:hypothetical protein
MEPLSKPSARRLPTAELVRLLGTSMGEEKASEAVRGALEKLRLRVDGTLSQDEAMAALDELANVKGLVGTVARFAKARVIFVFERA